MVSQLSISSQACQPKLFILDLQNSSPLYFSCKKLRHAHNLVGPPPNSHPLKFKLSGVQVYFSTYANPLYSTSDLLARGFTAAIHGLVATAPDPLAAALGPLAVIALGPEIVLT